MDTLSPMAVDRDIVLQEALSLPSSERADVAAELLASLDERPPDDPEAVRTAWADELEHRARRARSGDAGVPWREVRDRIRNKLHR